MGTREEYLEELEARLQQRAAEIDTLKAKAEKFDRSTMREIRKRIETLEEQQTALQARIAGVRTAAAWEDAKSGIEEAWETMTNALENALHELGNAGKQDDDRN